MWTLNISLSVCAKLLFFLQFLFHFVLFVVWFSARIHFDIFCSFLCVLLLLLLSRCWLLSAHMCSIEHLKINGAKKSPNPANQWNWLSACTSACTHSKFHLVITSEWLIFFFVLVQSDFACIPFGQKPVSPAVENPTPKFDVFSVPAFLIYVRWK